MRNSILVTIGGLLIAVATAALAWAFVGLDKSRSISRDSLVYVAEVPDNAKVATFAAGCFWCTESDFDKVNGVVKTVSGFIGGTTPNPTYKQVTYGETGHYEAVEITYDPSKVTYQELLDVYWRNVDFLDDGGQFCDRGSSYKPAIFVHSPEQRIAAEASKKDVQSKVEGEVVVPIRDATKFTAAEAYHQDFYKKNPFHYQRYRIGCGRDARLEELRQLLGAKS